MEIKVTCSAVLSIFMNFFMFLIILFIPCSLIIGGIRTGSPGLIISGVVIISLLIKLILSTEKEIIFGENQLEIIFFFSKPVTINYEQIVSVTFQPRVKNEPESVLIKLKKRIKWRKKFTFAVDENHKQLLDVFNLLRSKAVPTGLNKVGEKYLYFDRYKNQYFHWFKRNE